jgi:hypothetical protein
MMEELENRLNFKHKHSTPYYPQANGQVEVVSKELKTMVQRIVDTHKYNWHLMLNFTLWAYQTSIKTMTGLTPFPLTFGKEAVIVIECEIPPIRLIVQLLPDTSPMKKH